MCGNETLKVRSDAQKYYSVCQCVSHKSNVHVNSTSTAKSVITEHTQQTTQNRHTTQ